MSIIPATLLLVLLVVSQASAVDDRHDIGRSFYIPKTDMLDGHSGGYEILKSNLEGCIHEVSDSKLKRVFVFYEDQQSFYHSLGTEVSIGGNLRNSFTMGATISSTSGGISTTDTKIQGATLDIAAYSREVYIDVGCIYGSELAQEVKTRFEQLPTKIDNPEQDNSWIAYHTFLQTFGSHFVQKAYYGSRLSQYIFSKHATTYNSRDFNIKACENFEGVANIGKFGVNSCQGFNKSDAKTVDHMEVNAKLILKGGTKETRAALSSERTKELIEQFIKEANIGTLPIRYTYIPIWTLLKTIYLNTEHLVKVVNLENYYKGYLNFGCPLMKVNNYVVQKFQLVGSTTLPAYQCVIAPMGCHQYNDCHYRDAFWCECRGDTCIRYGKQFDYNTGTTRETPYAFTDSGWGWQGCTLSGFTCYCTEPSPNWKVIWETNDESSKSLIAFSRSTEDSANDARKDQL